MSGYGKHDLAARLWAGTGAGAAWRNLGPGRRRVSILAYHRVYDMGEEDAFPFDPELVSATTRGFRWQMEHVLRVGTPITFSHLADILDGEAEAPRHAIIVTFDDGHRDSFTHAFPILRELGIPATVFVPTGYVGSKGTFWFDRVAQLLYRAPRGRIHIASLDFDTDLGEDVSSRRESTKQLLRALKSAGEAIRRTALADLEAALARVSPPEDDALSGPLTWDEVNTMAQSGIEFGSHTVTHPVLTRVDDRTLAEELTVSRETLEGKLGHPVTVLAYPSGEQEVFDQRVVAATARAGYRFGVSYVSGVNLGVPDPYRLKRLHVERYTSPAYFEALLDLPALFA